MSAKPVTSASKKAIDTKKETKPTEIISGVDQAGVEQLNGKVKDTATVEKKDETVIHGGKGVVQQEVKVEQSNGVKHNNTNVAKAIENQQANVKKQIETDTSLLKAVVNKQQTVVKKEETNLKKQQATQQSNKNVPNQINTVIDKVNSHNEQQKPKQNKQSHVNSEQLVQKEVPIEHQPAKIKLAQPSATAVAVQSHPKVSQTPIKQTHPSINQQAQHLIKQQAQPPIKQQTQPIKQVKPIKQTQPTIKQQEQIHVQKQVQPTIKQDTLNHTKQQGVKPIKQQTKNHVNQQVKPQIKQQVQNPIKHQTSIHHNASENSSPIKEMIVANESIAILEPQSKTEIIEQINAVHIEEDKIVSIKTIEKIEEAIEMSIGKDSGHQSQLNRGGNQKLDNVKTRLNQQIHQNSYQIHQQAYINNQNSEPFGKADKTDETDKALTDKLNIERSKSPIKSSAYLAEDIEAVQEKEEEENYTTNKSSERQLINQGPNRQQTDKLQQEHSNLLKQLKNIDDELLEIKCSDNPNLKRKVKAQQEDEARKQAQKMLKQLKLQKAQIEERRRKDNQRKLSLFEAQAETVKRLKEQAELKHKEEKRLAIEKRLEEDRKRREQRILLDKHSNHLLQQLKLQREVQKTKQQLPSQIVEVHLKQQNAAQKKQGFSLEDIETHQRRYQAMKIEEEEMKRQRAESVSQMKGAKYAKNVWLEQIQQEDLKKKQERNAKKIARKEQLEKRMKYGQLVKNIFLKNPSPEKRTDTKPKTPDPLSVQLPKIKDRRATHNDTRFRSLKKADDPRPILEEKPTEQQFFGDEEEDNVAMNHKKMTEDNLKKSTQDQLTRKLREQERRRQTKERLKKMQEKALERPPAPPRQKYQNYLGAVNVRKNQVGQTQEWKRIMANDKLSKQEKYAMMIDKAAAMENKARMREDKKRHVDDDEAVNLYIGSIQAKLALLEKI